MVLTRPTTKAGAQAMIEAHLDWQRECCCNGESRTLLETLAEAGSRTWSEAEHTLPGGAVFPGRPFLLPITQILGTKIGASKSAQLTSLQAPSSSRRHTALHSRYGARGASLPLPAREVDRVEYARAEKAEATRRAYRSDFEIFRAWCSQHQVSALPASPESVAAFLAHEAERQVRPSTIGRRVAAIRYAQKLAGLPLPTDDERVRATVRGIRRSLGAAPSKKMPATAERVIGMAPLAGTRLSAIRDRALLLIGFAGAFRRSELVATNAEDLAETPEGLRMTIRRIKPTKRGMATSLPFRGG